MVPYASLSARPFYKMFHSFILVLSSNVVSPLTFKADFSTIEQDAMHEYRDDVLIICYEI